MTKILHPDQTTKQPVFWACLNPDCKPALQDYLTFESDQPKCPKCTSEGLPYVHKRVLIHFLVTDKMGHIVGEKRRYRMACDKGRFELATATNGEAATAVVAQVNCPGCLQEIGRMAIDGDLGEQLNTDKLKELRRAELTRRNKSGGGFCC